MALGANAYLNYRRSGKFRSRVIGIIPARFASSRFEGKPLVHILGKPMIQVIASLLFFVFQFLLFLFPCGFATSLHFFCNALLPL